MVGQEFSVMNSSVEAGIFDHEKNFLITFDQCKLDCILVEEFDLARIFL